MPAITPARVASRRSARAASPGVAPIANYATLNIGRMHSLRMAIAGFVEWTLIGVVIGVVYKPAVPSARANR